MGNLFIGETGNYMQLNENGIIKNELEDEPVLGEEQARIKLDMIESEKELAEYIRDLLDRFEPIKTEVECKPYNPNITEDEKFKPIFHDIYYPNMKPQVVILDYNTNRINEIPELEVYDIVIIEGEDGSILQECVCDIYNYNNLAVTNSCYISWLDAYGNRLNKYYAVLQSEVYNSVSYRLSFKVKEVYRRVDEDTFKIIWRAE